MRDILRHDDVLAALSAQDRALASRLALGATSAEALLDEVIDERASRPSSMEPRVRDALRVAAFEICYLSTPEAVAVSQGVELVREVAPRAAGMANAILRRIAREVAPEVERSRAASAPDARQLSLMGGLPESLAKLLLDACGADQARELALAQLDPAPIWVAENPLASAGDVASQLADAGFDPHEAPAPGAWRLGSPAGLAASELVSSASVVIADLAAQLVALVAAPEPGARLLEVGQGRGTKSILLESACARRGGACEIAGVDAVASKAGIASERMARAGLAGHVSSITWDASLLDAPDAPEELRGSFDAAFVDAPCTGTGTMRRHPEVPSRFAAELPGAPSELASLQLRLLEQAAARVAAGGTLCYSTCSVLPAECEDVVDAFLASEAGVGFEVVPASSAPAAELAGDAIAKCETSEGYLRTWPERDGMDGHFCALLRRRDG